MKFSAALFGSVALLLSAAPVLACQGENVLYEDAFAEVDPSWGASGGAKIEGGKLVVLPEQNSGYALENQVGFFEDFDVCVDVVQHNNDPTTGYASILFWGTDYDNFYTFDVATNGYIRVARKQNKRWLIPVAWTQLEGIIKAGEEPNQLRIVAKGNRATLYVNGKEVASFRGQPPQGGGLLGVYGASPAESTGTYDFDNFKVTAPS